MSLRTSRLRRPGVIECPVARSAAPAGSAALIERGVERRQERVAELAADADRRGSDDPGRPTERPDHP
jgi:hypothetical protein